MRSSTVVFRGISQVVQAYEANDMCAWAIMVTDKDIMFAYEGSSVEDGSEMLMESLKRLYEGGSQAAFVLRVYELPGKGKIMSNTPWSRSFPFKLYEDENSSPYNKGRDSYAREIDEKLKLLTEENKLLREQLDEALEEPQKEGGINGFIAGIVEDPYMKQIFMQALGGIIKKVVPMNNDSRPAAVAGMGQQQAETASVLQPGQPEKVQQAINVLCARDPLLGDHLLKVAEICINNPGQYNMLIGMLK